MLPSGAGLFSYDQRDSKKAEEQPEPLPPGNPLAQQRSGLNGSEAWSRPLPVLASLAIP